MLKRYCADAVRLCAATIFTTTAVLITCSCVSGDEPAEPRRPGTWRTRAVDPRELTSMRGEVEDRLRTDILSVFLPEDTDLDALREALNSPWSKSIVEYLTNLLLEGVPEEGQRTMIESQWDAVACLLAYVGKTQADQPLYEDVKNAFDRLYGRAYAVRKASLSGRALREGFLEATSLAIHDYGSLELVGDMFWKAIEEWGGFGGPAGSVLEDLGDETVLAKLREWQKQPRWDKSSRQSDGLDETVFLLESLLKYPELRKIADRYHRLDVARDLRSPQEANLRQIEGMIRNHREGEVKTALEAILARLKAEQDKPPGPNK